MDDYRALPTIWTDDHGVTGHIFGIGEPVARIVIETREGTVGIDAPWLDDLAGAVERAEKAEAEAERLRAELAYATGADEKDVRDEHGGLGFGGR